MNGNITLTFYDSVSNLIPGIILVFVINNLFGLQLLKNDSSLSLILIFVLGYLLGSILFLISNILFHYIKVDTEKKLLYSIDKAIKKYFTIKIKRNNFIREKLCQLIKERYEIDFSDDKLGMYSFADSITSDLSKSDKEILLAKEGMYRVLTTLFVVLTITILISNKYNNFLIAAGGIILVLLASYGREYFKELKNQRIYTLAFLKIKEKYDRLEIK